MRLRLDLPDTDHSQVVLIGAARYNSLHALPAVDNNLVGLRDALTQSSLWGVPARNCTVLDNAVLDRPDSVRLTIERVEAVAQQARDALIVYYAGHGLPDEEGDGALYLALPTSEKSQASYTALPFENIRRAVRKSKAIRKIVIVDCCYSGLAHQHEMAAADLGARLSIGNTCVMTASAATRPALSPTHERYTAFTGELLQIITTGVVGGPPLLDMGTLFDRLREGLISKSLPEPDMRNRGLGASIALVRNVGFVPLPGADDRGVVAVDVRSILDLLEPIRDICEEVVQATDAPDARLQAAHAQLTQVINDLTGRAESGTTSILAARASVLEVGELLGGRSELVDAVTQRLTSDRTTELRYRVQLEKAARIDRLDKAFQVFIDRLVSICDQELMTLADEVPQLMRPIEATGHTIGRLAKPWQSRSLAKEFSTRISVRILQLFRARLETKVAPQFAEMLATGTRLHAEFHRALADHAHSLRPPLAQAADSFNAAMPMQEIEYRLTHTALDLVDYAEIEAEVRRGGTVLLNPEPDETSVQFLLRLVMTLALVILGHPMSFVSGRDQIAVVKRHVEQSVTKALRQPDTRAKLSRSATKQISEQMQSMLSPMRRSLEEATSFIGSDVYRQDLERNLPTLHQVVDEALLRVEHVLDQLTSR
ncbi:caspase family protein [Dactylosporangium sp. NPDC005555]|uniref:caspase family protein n=1 Tax=Dactylosporangium sp. NPDC005555 TaxID=3154889 RepID=UPI0033A996A2